MERRTVSLLALISFTYLIFIYVQFNFIHERLPPVASLEQQTVRRPKLPVMDFQNIPLVFEKPFVPSNYNLTETCEKRANRTNPLLQAHPCEVNSQFNSNFADLLASGPTRVQNQIEGIPPPSSRNCTSGGFCEYRNVCVLPSSYKVMWIPENPNNVPKAQDFGFYIYKEGEAQKRTFSWHYEMDVESYKNLSPFMKYYFIEGTTLWFDQSYQHPCHQGHSSEFFTKLHELRHYFPGYIDRVLYYSVSLAWSMFCYRTCNPFRTAFEDIGFHLPPIFTASAIFSNSVPVCFERLLVPAYTQQHFTSMEFANMHRDSALKMCKVEKREAPKRTMRILFYERGWDRAISNYNDLCEFSKHFGLSSSVITDDTPFCEQVAAVYSSDIIVSTDGSQNQVMSYARPGSVWIIVFPVNFRVPDWKLLAYYCGLRTLELVSLDPSLSDLADIPSMVGYLSADMKECFKWQCRSSIKRQNTRVPLENFKLFIQHANRIFNDPNVEECEKPLPWPHKNLEIGELLNRGADFGIYSAYGYANNWKLCEPPYPDCLCCKVQSCMNATNLERGF